MARWAQAPPVVNGGNVRNRGAVSTWIGGAVLAAPFVFTNVWLFLVVGGFGGTRAGLGVLQGIALGCAVMLLARCGRRPGVLLGTLLYLLAWIVCVGDAASWFMQGTTFNERFFAHVDAHNVAVSFQAYPWAVGLGVLVLLALLGIVARILYATSFRRLTAWGWLPMAALLVFVVGVDAAPHRLYAYFHTARQAHALAASTDGARIQAMLNQYPTRPETVRATPGRNLVLVYLESLERTYTDASRFPGLTPNIDRWRTRGLDFSGMQTYPGAGYTIAGLFASQCGAPYLLNSVFGSDINALGFVPGNDNTSANTFHPELACLGDVLHAAGYHQTYLSGVALEFANTDQFFRMHHYDAALGAPQIEQRHAGRLPLLGWGLTDEAVFAEALTEYRRGVASGRPFSVVLSTIDTHPPDGYLLPECTAYAPIHNAMLDAVHCTDQLLGRFLDSLSREPGWRDTVVVVMSDHLAMRNVASALYPAEAQRQPLLFAVNAGQGERPARMLHMDVAPTVLDLLGVHSNVRFLAGASKAGAGAADAQLPDDAVAEAVLRDALWDGRKAPQLCADDHLLRWEQATRSLDVGGWELPFMRGGWQRDSLEDDHVLMTFIDARGASLQMLPIGMQDHWLGQAMTQGKDVFLAMPFWLADGSRRLALKWMTPGGAWASLGAVKRIQDVDLRTPQCHGLLQALHRAAPGTRLDFSGDFGTQPVPANAEHLPGEMPSQTMPAPESAVANAMFMYQRMAARQPGDVSIGISPPGWIFMPPAQEHTSWVEFDVSGVQQLTLAPRINPLNAWCMARTDTGIVGVSLALDGQSVRSRFIVDRHETPPIVLDTRGARRLRVEVDQGNGTTYCDWFAVGFPSVVLKSAVATGARADATK